MPAPFPYTKLAGARGALRKSSLWQGADHLLLIKGTRFSEEYRRFYYRDIQAITLRRTARSGSLGVWLIPIFSLLLLALIAITRSLTPIGWTTAVAVSFFLIYRAIVSIRFSCQCSIQTAVSREEIPAVLRSWTAKKVLGRIRLKVLEAQGNLPDDLRALREQAVSQTSSAINQGNSNTLSPKQIEKAATEGVTLATLSFSALLVNAAVTFWYANAAGAVLGSRWVQALAIALLLAEGVPIVWSLTKIHNLRALRVLKRSLIGALVFVGVRAYIWTVSVELFWSRTALSAPHISPRWIVMTSGAIELLLGIGGLTLILLNWQTYRRSQLSAT